MKILIVFGTRPEAIKMAPVVRALKADHRFRPVLCLTGQHREMLAGILDFFGLTADHDLAIMKPGQDLVYVTSAVLAGMQRLLDVEKPDWVLVHGDTTTAMAAALGAFYAGVRIGHVEAGLRTGDLERPFPEEANRRLIDQLAGALFAPTVRARSALLAEGLAAEKIHVVGNTVIDALEAIAAEMAERPDRDEVLVTVHRRESFGAPLRGIFTALRRLAESFPEVLWIYPVHKNPNVHAPAFEILSGAPNLRLCEPLGYRELVRHLRRCRFVLTDSGGIQEEAPTFGKPVLVLREKTERPEGVEAGVARLVGTDPERIFAEAARLLRSPEAYRRMACAVNPYGDGHAAERIAAILGGEPWTPFQQSS